MAKGEKRLETLVGFFLLVGLVLLGGMIVRYGRLGEQFRDVYGVTVAFDDASGIIKGSHVRLAGATVGQVVEEPELTSAGKVRVKVVIHEEAPRIDRNAAFQITSLTVLGDKAITITPPPPEEAAGEYLQDGDFIEGGGPSGLDRIQSDAERIASDAAVFMERSRTTLTRIDQAIEEARSVSKSLNESLTSINEKVLTEQNMTNFGETLADLRGASRNIREASLEMKPLLADAQRALQNLDRAAASADGAFAKASSEMEKLGPALEKVPKAVDSIAQAADDASDALESVTDEEGLLGTLAYDKEPAEDARKFLQNLRRHGILGYRDEETYDERDPRNRFRGRRR